MLRHTRVLFCMLAIVLMAAVIGQAAMKPHQTAKPHAKITAAQAQAIALKKYPGKVITKTKLENEEGVWQYSVMIQSGKKLREVMVNAKTGHIDNVEITTAAKEGLEAKGEAKGKPAGKPKPKPTPKPN